MSIQTPADRLKWAREHHGMYKTPTEAAKAFGWTVSTYLGHENGDRNPSRLAAKRYARAYRVRWEWLLEGEGVPKATTPPPVRLAGQIGHSSQVRFYDNPECLDTSETPVDATGTTTALEIREGSMRGIADDGWLIFFDDDRKPPTAALTGKLCVVELQDGNVLVRTLQPGRRKGYFDLESPTAPTLRDQRVKWAARVTWIKPR